MLNGSETDALALLESDSTITSLVGWFGPPYHALQSEEEITKTAETNAFQDYALVTARPTPRHGVKEKFHKAVGQRVVARLKESAKAKADADPGLATKIDAIAFHAESSDYGRFDPWLDAYVDVRLKQAVTTAGNDVLTLLKAIILNDVNPLTNATFIAIWDDGGETVIWFKDRLRRRSRGTTSGFHSAWSAPSSIAPRRAPAPTRIPALSLSNGSTRSTCCAVPPTR